MEGNGCATYTHFFQLGPIASDRPECQHTERSPGQAAAPGFGAELHGGRLPCLSPPPLPCPRQLRSPPRAPIPSCLFLRGSGDPSGHRLTAFWKSPSLNSHPYAQLLKLGLPQRPSFSDPGGCPSPATARVLKGFGVESL